MSTKIVERIAIIGATGRIGGAFAKALVGTGRHTVTALTRQESNAKLPDGVQGIRVNYDDEASIIDALRDQEFLVITLGVRAPADLHKRITIAAGKAGIRYIMPNAYGYPAVLSNEPQIDDAYTKAVLERIQDAQNGTSSSITLPCGFWYEWSLATGEQWFGFTIKERKVTFFDDGQRVITVSTWDQCGRALAALLSLPEARASPSVSEFANREVPVFSFQVSQRDMLDSLHRVLGTTDSDWEIKFEPVEKRIQDGQEELSRGTFTGFAKMLYGGVFLARNTTSNFASTGQAMNQVLGLPEEDLDEATRRTVAMVEEGWNPFANMN
ncbi:hypothetical protein N7468_000791 [Penicillium chermesinum]|uniref:NAD(P)-binding domain-containing protein n=1 Tax=Penicillium chermesinum TaxID=63820 RepID=A0A9W9PFD1_9EURO|nr:uncharacterized protein N7468_000791 [Penicillium chermesinum]KAJ5245808.1 hypothetical protein N7468_000791 [Penicillium chermesinum]KAJ6144108.1 hypothetical protein N7470_008003 [Penicillium chermesinum]